MKKDTVVSLKKPVEELDPLTALLRAGAQQLLCEAVVAELAEYLSQYQAEREADGRRCMVRNGYLPARTVRTQRCWVHKTANVLNKLPKGLQAKAKQGLQAIWMAESRAAASLAFDRFIHTYEDKYPKATACLASDRDALLTFYDFPAAHWQSIRTTNPIESTFATLRLRTARTRGCVSRTSLLTMVFKLGLCAEQNWRRMRGFHHLADVIENVKFIDGVKEETIQQHQQAA